MNKDIRNVVLTFTLIAVTAFGGHTTYASMTKAREQALERQKALELIQAVQESKQAVLEARNIEKIAAEAATKAAADVEAENRRLQEIEVAAKTQSEKIAAQAALDAEKARQQAALKALQEQSIANAKIAAQEKAATQAAQAAIDQAMAQTSSRRTRAS